MKNRVAYICINAESDDPLFLKYVKENNIVEKRSSYLSLKKFALIKLNKFIDETPKCERIINIETVADQYEVCPNMCDTSTWYDRRYVDLCVWYEEKS